jgi:signal transduction histidine kinase
MLKFLQHDGPPLANAALGSLVALMCLFWVVRRREMAFGWLAVIGAAFLVQSRVANSPNWAWLPWAVLPVSFLCFIVGFTRLSWSGGVKNLLASVAKFLLRGLPGEASWHRRAIIVASLVTIIALAHDWYMASGKPTGLPFNIVPFAGLGVFTLLAFVLAQRVLEALSVVENLNQILEDRVRAAHASLAASEAARRALEVSGAISKERDRLMREIHDGIGSSLVTSISAAERSGGSVDGVSLLKSALTDLRVAVDSLEPVHGDIATLLASLRYRVEPDLRKAGISFDWQVQEVPEVEWLDAVNALHILRIFQEAFGNILGHAEATRVAVRCQSDTRDGVPGILIQVSDNGKGYGDNVSPRGHGRKNMAHRAQALGCKLTQNSSPGKGTSVTLWLPQQHR